MTGVERLDLAVALVAARCPATDQLRVVRVWCRDSVVLVYLARGVAQHAYVQGYN